MVKKYTTFLLKLAVSGGLIFFILHSIGVERFKQQLTQASWQGVLQSLMIYIISNIFGALQWHLLLRTKKIKLSFARVLSFYHVGLFFNNFLIGNLGGDVVRVLDVRRSVGKEKGALSTVFFDRFIGLFAMATLALLSIIVLAHRLVAEDTILFIVLVFIIWMMTVLFLFHKRVARKLAWIFKLLLPKDLHVKAKSFYDSLDDYRNQKKVLLWLFLLSLFIQTLRIMTHIFAARAIGVDLSWNYFFFFIPIVALAASLPISIGGLGVREQSAVAMFSQVGVAPAQTVAFEFLAYLIGVLATLPGGLVFALRREQRVSYN